MFSLLTFKIVVFICIFAIVLFSTLAYTIDKYILN